MNEFKFPANGPNSYRRMVGVGGIGSGILFALDGNHDLGRNESRSARLLDVRDYCKLHIVTHYISMLLSSSTIDTSFQILPIGKVGADSAGERLLKEMIEAGLDTNYVEKVNGKPTLFSVCYQYPDRTGGNITNSESAASMLTTGDIDRITPLLEASGPRCIVLALPEVTLQLRHYLLKLGTKYQAFRVASFTSAEIPEALQSKFFSLIDLLALNEEEAGSLIGRHFDPLDPRPFLDEVSLTLTAAQPLINIVISAGRAGAFAFADNRWTHSPALPVQVASTLGAGDALLAGVLTALIAGVPLIIGEPSGNRSHRALGSAIDFGVLLASYSITSPHTIHPQADLNALLNFAEELGLILTDPLSQLVVKGN